MVFGTVGKTPLNVLAAQKLKGEGTGVNDPRRPLCGSGWTTPFACKYYFVSLLVRGGQHTNGGFDLANLDP